MTRMIPAIPLILAALTLVAGAAAAEDAEAPKDNITAARE